MVRYLTNIHRIWTFILLDNIEMGPLLDATTVAAIETLQPKLSLADAAVVRKLMSSHKIFPYILDGSTRGRILSRLQTLNEPILSLRTFLEDTKLLEVATKPLKRLLGSKQKEGLVHCFRAAHTGTQISITDETSPSSPRRVSSSIFAEDRPYICYLRLVLFCMRYFYGLTGIAPRKERGQSLADIPTENASFVYTKLAYLAQRLGFSTPIMAEMSLPQAEELASMEFLEELCPSDRMNLSALDRSEIARDISSRVQRAQHESREESIPPNFTTNLIELRKDHRMGRPFANSYRHDRKHLFLSKIYGSYNPPRAEYLTTLAVLRYTFIAFFGNGESHTDDYTPLQPTAQTVAMRLSPSASEHGTSETSASPPPTLPSRSRSDTPMSSFGEAFGLSDSPAVDQPSPTSPEPITMAANRPSVYTESIYSQDSISSNEIVAPSLLELARAGRGAVGRRDVTLIDCNTKSSQRVMTKDLQGVFVEAANNGMGFATMVSDTQIERHNVDTVELAAVYNRVVFVYQKQKQGPYIYSDLEGFLQSFER